MIILKIYAPETNHLRFIFQAGGSDAWWGYFFWTLSHGHRRHWCWGCSMLRCRGALSPATSAATCWVAITISVKASCTSCVTAESVTHRTIRWSKNFPGTNPDPVTIHFPLRLTLSKKKFLFTYVGNFLQSCLSDFDVKWQVYNSAL
jgi:hypothetical protein